MCDPDKFPGGSRQGRDYDEPLRPLPFKLWAIYIVVCIVVVGLAVFGAPPACIP